MNQNAPCSCGSNKQYKRCCGRQKNGPNISPKKFKKYNTQDLMQSLAGLFLYNKNHGKNIRLENALSLAAQHGNATDRKMDSAELNEFLREYFPSHHAEDPPTNLFVEELTYYGGGYLVMPGIAEMPTFILKCIFLTLNHFEGAFPDQFLKNCHNLSALILNISDLVLAKAGIRRYSTGGATDSYISLPKGREFRKLKDAVTISSEEIETIAKTAHIDLAALDPFVIELGLNDYMTDEGQSSFVSKPILSLNGEYIVANPASLCYSLIHEIKAQAYAFAQMQQMHVKFQIIVENDLVFNLHRLGFRKKENYSNDQGLSIVSLYEFDADKIALVQFLKFGLDTESIKSDLMLVQRQSFLSDLKQNHGYADYQVLEIVVVSSMSNDVAFGGNGIEGAKTIYCTPYDIKILAESKKSSAIEMWKFAMALEETVPIDFQIVLPNLLDKYQIYLDHSHSFYLSDAGFDIRQWVPGRSQELMRLARQRKDEHAAELILNDEIVNIDVERFDQYMPVYLNVNDLQQQILRLAIDVGTPVVWVTADTNNFGTPMLKGWYWEMAQALAYWVWQIFPYVEQQMKTLNAASVEIKFLLQDENGFENIDETFHREDNIFDLFIITAHHDGFSIIIPHQLIPFFSGSNNDGDRILVRQLLEGVNSCLQSHQKDVMSGHLIDEIVEKAAPFGNKKKILVMSSKDNLFLDPRHLIEVRYIQDFDVSSLLDKSSELLGANCPPKGPISGVGNKRKLCRDLVVRGLLPRLQAKASQYNSTDLLKKLMLLNEALIHDREDFYLKTPTRIACFVSVESQIEDAMEKMSDVSRTGIAVRCLIEHIAAEPTTGTAIVSDTAIDELISIMDGIISWGSLGDQLQLNLFEVEMAVLPTGRIGTQKHIAREVFDPYYNAKTEEDVMGAIRKFNSEGASASASPAEIPDFLDNAFIGEFNISFTRLCDFMDLLIKLGFDSALGYTEMERAVLFQVAQSNNFQMSEINPALDFLCLFERADVKSKPPGFEGFDISPWRFNRRLSLLRRPVVVVKSTDENSTLLFWSPRQILLSRMTIANQILTNRLKVSSDQSPVIKAMSRLSNERGDSLVSRVKQCINDGNLIVDDEVFISPNGKLKNNDDIGDVDVLVIDQKSKKIFSIECKGFVPSRNLHEMVEECNKLIGTSSNKGLIEKHAIRDKWIKENLEQVGAFYSLNLEGYSVVSVFVTLENMLFPFLKYSGEQMPFITVRDLEENGIEVLLIQKGI